MLACALTSVTCASNERGSNWEMGGAPLTYANGDLTVTPDGDIASVIVTWAGVRLLREVRDAPALTLIQPNHRNCTSFPVALGSGMLGGRSSVVVSDSGCGLWVATIDGEAISTQAWTDFFEPVGPDHNVLVEDVDSDGDGDVLIGGSFGFVACRANLEGRCQTYLSSPPYAFPGLIQPVLIPLHGAFGSEHAIFFMRDGSPEVVPLGPDGFEDSFVVEQVPTEFLKAFERFDQLAPISIPGCSAFAVGIGAFDEHANHRSRHPQVLTARTERTFEAITLGTELDETYAISVVQADAGTVTVVSVGEKEGRPHIEAGQIRSCSTFEILAVGEVEFNWRTPDAPADFTEPTLPHLGVRMKALRGGPDLVSAFHFDGFTLRRFEIDLGGHTVAQQNTRL